MTAMEAIWLVRLNYFDFSSRTSRKAFWLQILVILCLSAPLIAIEIADMFRLMNGEAPILPNEVRPIITGVGTLMAFILVIPYYALCSRRLHDTNRSAKWILACFIPGAGFFISFMVFFFLLQKGDPHENQYGAPPG